MVDERVRQFLIRMRVWPALRACARWARQGRSRLTRGGVIRRYLRGHPEPKLHLGCGKNVLEGWLNTDLEPIGGRMILLDVRKRFPFDDAQFVHVFSEHLIEHLDYAGGGHMLRECFRVLKPGGRLTVATPDLQFLLDLHRPDKSDLQKRYLAWSAETFYEGAPVRDAFIINAFVRNWGHRFIYDFDTLRDAMRASGFTDVVQLSLDDDSRLAELISHGSQIPEEFNRLETMAAEGTKSGGP